MTRATNTALCLLSIIFVLITASGLRSAENKSHSDSHATLRYLEIEVPEENPELWPRFGYRFGGPMRAEDFQHLLDDAGAPSQSSAPDTSRISNIKLTGELAGDAFAGTGSFEVQHQGSAPSFISLSGLRVALEDLQWDGAEPVQLGSVPSGDMVLLADRSGRVSFKWSIRLSRDSAGVLSAALKIPPADQSSLQLSVPPNYEFRSSQGIVSQNGETHIVSLGGRAETRIVLVPAGIAEAPSGTILVNQTSRYDLAKNGIAMVTQLDLRTLQRAYTNAEIELDLDSGIQVIGVSLGGRDVSWSAEQGADRIKVELSQPLPAKSTNQLQIFCIGPAVLDSIMELPTIRPVGLIWQGADVQLKVEPGLSLQSLASGSTHELLLKSTRRDADGTQVDVRLPDPTDRISAVLALATPEINCDRVFAWKIAPAEVRGRVSMTLQAESKALREVNLNIAPDWSLAEEGIRVFRKKNGKTVAIRHRTTFGHVQAGGKKQTVRLTLETPLLADESLQIELEASYEGPLFDPLTSLENLLFAEVQQARQTVSAVSISTSRSITAQLAGPSELQSVSWDAISPEHNADWLEEISGGALVGTDDDFADVKLNLKRSEPRVKARVETQVHAQSKRVRQRYELTLTPDPAGVESLRFVFRPPPSQPPTWILPKELQDQGVTQRRVTPPSQNRIADAAVEIWQFDFPKRQTQPFQLTADVVSLPMSDGRYSVPLLSVVGSLVQQGSVLILGERGVPVSVYTRQTDALPLGPPEQLPESGQVAWGAYRYLPSPAESGSSATIALELTEDGEANTFAWQLQLKSHWSADQPVFHTASWQIHNESRDNVDISLPATCDVQSILLNNSPAKIERMDESSFRVSLANAPSSVLLTIAFTTRRQPLGFTCDLKPPVAKLNVPVLHKTWSVSIPEGYAFCHGDVGHAANFWGGASRIWQSSDVAANDTAHNATASAGLRWLQSLERDVLERSETWGQVLLLAQLQNGDREGAHWPSILVDQVALAKVGVMPDTPLSGDVNSTLPERLQASRIVIVLTDHRVLFTGEEFINQYAGQVRSTDSPCLWIATSQALRDLLDDEETVIENYVTPQVWASTLLDPTYVDTNVSMSGTPDVYRFRQSILKEGKTVSIYHRLSFRALSAALFLAAAGIALWWKQLALHLRFAAFLVAVGIALFAWGPWSMVIWAFAAGLLFGSLARYASHEGPQRSSNSTDEPSASTSPVSASILWIVLSVSLLQASTLHAQADEAERVFPVLNRVNAEGDSTGWVWLPTEFERLLRERARRNQTSVQEWLVDHASYELELRQDATSERLEPGWLSINYDLTVVQDLSSVAIPLQRDQFLVAEDWVKVNNEIVEASWSAESTSLRLPVGGRGRHRVQLRVKPIVNVNSDTSRFALSTLPSANANLRLVTPQAYTGISIPNCVGAINEEVDEENGKRIITAALGPVPTLEVSWQDQLKRTNNGVDLDASEFVWLSLGNSSTLKITVRGDNAPGDLTQLTFEVDPALQAIGNNVARVSEDSPSGRLLRVPVEKTPLGFEATLTLRLPDAPQSGLFAMPHVRPVGIRRRTRWLAVNTEDDMKFSAKQGLTVVENKQLLSQWADNINDTAKVYKCNSRSDVLLLNIEPNHRQPTATETTTCTFTDGTNDLTYRAEIQPNQSTCQHHRLRIPPGVELRSVRLRIPQEPQLASQMWWGRHGQDVHIFLTEGHLLPCVIEIEATQEVTVGGKAKVPMIKLLATQVVSSQLEILCTSDVQVELLRHPGFELMDDDLRFASNENRFVAAMGADSLAPKFANRSCLVNLRGNDLAAEATQLTRLHREQDRWKVSVDYRVRPLSGILDVVQFEVPAGLLNELSLDTALQYRIENTLDAATKLLTIRTPEPTDGEFIIRFELLQQISSGEDVLPSILPVGNIVVQRYVALPTTIDDRAIDWETSGLLTVPELPLQSWSSDSGKTSEQYFQIVNDPHQAALSLSADLSGVPLASLVDVEFAWHDSGECMGRASIDMEPAGLASCVLELPEEMSLIYVRTDGRPTQVSPLSDSRWRLRLPSSKLPVHLEVLYAGTVDHSAEDVRAYAPVIEGVAVERTLWTIRVPLSHTFSATSDDVSPMQHDITRLRSLTDIVRLPRHLRVAYSSDELQDWLLPWQQRWERQRRQIARNELVLAEIGDEDMDTIPLQAIDLSYRQTISEFALPDDNAAQGRHSPASADQDQRWRDIIADTPLTLRRMAIGASRSLSVECQPTQSNANWWHVLAAVIALSIAGLAFAWPRWRPRNDLAVRCHWAMLVAAMFLGVILLGPMVIGFALAVAAIGVVLWVTRYLAPDPLRSAIVIRTGREADDQAASTGS